MVAHISDLNRIGAIFPRLFNAVVKGRFFSGMVKRMAGFAAERSIPSLHETTLRRWAARNLPSLNKGNDQNRMVLVFVDEFSDYNDTLTGIKAMRLLSGLGYRVAIVKHDVSGRTFISKGFLRKARRIARSNIRIFSGVLNSGAALVGIEPSAILTFRDEYPDLAGKDLLPDARRPAESALMIDEFIAAEARAGRITADRFTDEHREILLHGHCQQKAVASTASTIEMLSLPRNFNVREIPSGCCGMAGSFGYEKEHYALSMKVGELVLFPEVREACKETIIAAPGTSCRHHIEDGTGRKALHPVEILFDAIK